MNTDFFIGTLIVLCVLSVRQHMGIGEALLHINSPTTQNADDSLGIHKSFYTNHCRNRAQCGTKMRKHCVYWTYCSMPKSNARALEMCIREKINQVAMELSLSEYKFIQPIRYCDTVFYKNLVKRWIYSILMKHSLNTVVSYSISQWTKLLNSSVFFFLLAGFFYID